MENIFKELFLQLAKTALTGRQQDIQLLIHRASKKLKSSSPELTQSLISLLQESPTAASPIRKTSHTPLPVDLDSRLQLLRLEKKYLDFDPILSNENQTSVNQIILERQNEKELLQNHLTPTKSILFTGPPGVGKTMAAKWIATKLDKPLLVLDLAAVMSSFLGRTGNNIRFVLDYAKNNDCILLLDELDAIAKRRDDNSEIGELKRLVTVLLQEIDDWPSSGLLIAATNHPDLLDPAVWRRFELILEFSIPDKKQIEKQINILLDGHIENLHNWSMILSHVFVGKSFSEIERLLNLARKAAAIEKSSLTKKIESLISAGFSLSHQQKVKIAKDLCESGLVSQRRAAELTGVARETIRKNTNNNTI